MAKHITVRAAQPHTKEQEPERVYITINGCFPYSTGSEEVEQLRQGFKEDAEKLFEALMSLPGGTFCQLLVLMLQEKASQFIVSHKPTAEYRKMEAANDLLESCWTLAQIVRDEFSADGESWDAIKRYQDEVNEALAVIRKARGEKEGQGG
jgi:hypothetical protein